MKVWDWLKKKMLDEKELEQMKAGLGTASLNIGGGIVVGALVALNAWGDVVNPQTNEILAGLRSGKLCPLRVGGKNYFADTLSMLRKPVGRNLLGFVRARIPSSVWWQRTPN